MSFEKLEYQEINKKRKLDKLGFEKNE